MIRPEKDSNDSYMTLFNSNSEIKNSILEKVVKVFLENKIDKMDLLKSQEMFLNLLSLPHFIGLQSKCHQEILKAYLVPNHGLKVQKAIKEKFNLDEVAFQEFNWGENNPKLSSQIHQLTDQNRYHIQWDFQSIKQQVQITYCLKSDQLSSELVYTELFKPFQTFNLDSNKEVEINENRELKVKFETMNYYTLLNYNKCKKGNVVMLRCVRAELKQKAVSEQEEIFERTLKIFNEFCQRLNDYEDQKYFDSLDTEISKIFSRIE